jgi:hypothetical protein
VKFIDYNYTQLPATIITASSQNANFPASNLRHQFRSKEWRSAGNFVVDTTNNKIDFKEASGGSVLTATVTTGTYSVATLITEIKTRMQAAGAATYSLTQSGQSGKWTLSTSGAYLSLLNTSGTNTAVNVLSKVLGFPTADQTGSTSYTGTLTALHTEEWIKFDLLTVENIDTVALLWPKENGVTLSSSAVVTVQANATDVWTSPAVDQVLTIDPTYTIASNYFTVDQTLRYWRVKIVDPQNFNLFVNLGVMVLGKDIGLQPPENGFTFGLTDTSVVTKTAYGHEYVDQYPTTAQMVFNYAYMSYTDSQKLDLSYRRNGIKTPVFVALDDTSSVFAKDHLAIYGKFSAGLLLTQIFRNIISSSVSISEIS